ncbi:MAG: type II toxin-antitoxin system RelE/ParE family toxin [Planctomycetota bacterium]
MNYTVELKPQAVRDLKRLQRSDATRVADAMEKLSVGLAGDVKKLTNFTPEYRLRVGSYRILFEIDQGRHVVVYRIVHRREAYR